MIIRKTKKFSFRINKKKLNGKINNFFESFWVHSVCLFFIPLISWEEHIAHTDSNDSEVMPEIKTKFKAKIPINDEHSIMNGDVERNF